MKRRRFIEERIAYALRQADTGKKVVDICCEVGVSQNTFYTWRRKYEGVEIKTMRACRLAGFSRSAWYKQPNPNE
ncbi:MAG: transposase [Bacteroidetes bacterium]|nr:transposase [Bacteroidota bacterium]